MRTRAYVAGIVLSAGAILGLHWMSIPPGAVAGPWPVVLYWFMLSLAAECFWIETSTGRGMVSMALAVNLASLFVLPPFSVLAVSGASVLISDALFRRRGIGKALFNSAQTVLALAACLTTGLWISGLQNGSQILVTRPEIALVVPAVFFLVNTFLLSLVISYSGEISFWRAWRENYGFGYHAFSFIISFVLGLSLVVAYERIGFMAGLLYLLFFYFVKDSYCRYLREKATAANQRTVARTLKNSS